MPATVTADRFSGVLPAGRGSERPELSYDRAHQTSAMLDRIDALCTRAQMADMDVDVTAPERDGQPTRLELWGLEQTIFLDVHPDGRVYEV